MYGLLRTPTDCSRFWRIFPLAAVCAAAWFGLVSNPARAADFMYVSMNDNTIVRYDVSLATSALVQASRSVFVPTGQGLSGVGGLAFDAAGNLYAANTNTITRYDSSGNRIGTDFVSSGQGVSVPGGIAFDSAGNLYVSNQAGNNTITRYDSSGNRIGTNFVASGQGLSDPGEIAFDSSGNLYAPNFSSGSTITRYDSSGTRIGTFFVPTGQGLNTPSALAFDAAGNLYATNFNANTITRYDSSGTRIGTFFVPTGQGLSQPRDLAFDTAGYLYVANGNNTISKYDTAGALQFSWTTPAIPGSLAFPTVVPEPSTYVLGGLATGLMALIARRRKAKRIA